jgi:hypothetical protein
MWTEAIDVVALRMLVRRAPSPVTTGSGSTSPRATSCRSRFRSRTHLFGSPAAGARPSTWLRPKGIGALTFSFVEADEARMWVKDYYDTIEIGVRARRLCSEPEHRLCDFPSCATRTEETAIDRGLDGRCHFFGYSLAHYYVFGKHRPGVTDVWAEFEQRRAEHGYDPEAVRKAAENPERLGATAVQQGVSGLRGSVGTPDQIREYLNRYEELGVDQVIFVSQAGRNRHEDIMESLELFGKTVLPEFAERDEKLSKEKEARLAPIIEKVMARKPETDHPPLPSPDYSFPAMARAAAERVGADEFLAAMDEFATQRAMGTAPRPGTPVRRARGCRFTLSPTASGVATPGPAASPSTTAPGHRRGAARRWPPRGAGG